MKFGPQNEYQDYINSNDANYSILDYIEILEWIVYIIISISLFRFIYKNYSENKINKIFCKWVIVRSLIVLILFFIFSWIKWRLWCLC